MRKENLEALIVKYGGQVVKNINSPASCTHIVAGGESLNSMCVCFDYFRC